MRFQPLGMEGPLAELAGHQLRRVGCGRAPRRGEVRWTRAFRGVTEVADGAADQVVVLLQTVDAIRQFLVDMEHHGSSTGMFGFKNKMKWWRKKHQVIKQQQKDIDH